MKLKTLLASTVLMAGQSMAYDGQKLKFDVYNGDENSFSVTSTVVYGETEAMVIDTGFTKADALRIASKVYDSGKNLKTIFVSQADPDYYFGAETLHNLFPDARIVTTPAVKKVIEKKLDFKVGYWGPKMGTNAPVKPYIPQAITADSLTIDGVKVEIRGTEGVLAHRPYLWIPSERAILGNVGVYGHMHVWMADNQSNESVQAWIKQLKEMKNLNPKLVVPGHMPHNTSNLDSSLLDYTHSYIQDFVEGKSKSENSQQLVKFMVDKYPNATEVSSLQLGAKVHKGEMKW
ncbi:MBL fold metallo-hydrolase [Vibrio sp. vnigr-6D03]|uniref:MBL fold metallo-hydrolase n=1 Tax=Vibrio sp. vnigr-6D03 TaxID=2058088 RepID=UPI000C34805E|nr:MBL fold metallo-hydrolase [Vibrio sp. vnigr-6D03]PKF77637.1 MBL fold metallo-hydrolase [Vibrio sp. vnigr-6D03]